MRAAAGILIATLLGADLGFAQDAPAPAVGLAQGTAAKPLERRQPVYPIELRDRGYEGFVFVSFVVKADGTTADAIIEDSNGPLFEQSALEAVRTWRYTPATFDGKPVDQAYTRVTLVFTFDRPSPPSGRFIAKYRQVEKQLAANELEAAERQITSLAAAERVSLTEYTYLAVLESALREKQGDPVRQLASLQRASINDGEGLQRDAYTRVLANTFALEVEQQELRQALKTYAKLDARKGDPPAEIAGVANRIREKAASSALLGRKGRIAAPDAIAAGSAPRLWSHNLLRKEMGLQDVTGTLRSVEFRCSYHRVVDTEVPDGKTWKIPASWGDDCFVYVAGEPGSTFTLVEYPAEPAPAR